MKDTKKRKKGGAKVETKLEKGYSPKPVMDF